MLDPAVVALIQKLDRAPDDASALEAVWNAMLARGEVQTLAVLAEKVAARRTGRSSADLYARAGDLWMEQLRQQHKAKAAWAKALGVVPGHPWAARSRARCDGLTKAEECADENDLAGQEKHLRAVLALEGLAGISATEPRKALTRILMGRAKGAEAESTREAAKREAAGLLGAIAEEGGPERADDTARAALQLWEGEPRAFLVLERSERDKGRTAELVMLRALFLTANPSHAEVPRVRRELGDNYFSLGRVDEAIALLEPHAKEDPEVPPRLLRWYERAGRSDKVASLLATRVLPDDPAARMKELRARIERVPAVEREARLTLWRSVLEVAPADPEGLMALENNARMAGLGAEAVPAYRDLCDALVRAAAVESPDTERRAQWLEQAARAAEAPLGDAERACAAWDALRNLPFLPAPRARAAEEALARWLPKAGRWDEHLALLQRRMQRAEDAAQAVGEGGDGARDPKALHSARVAWARAKARHAPEPAVEASLLRAWFDAEPTDEDYTALLLDAYGRAQDAQGLLHVRRAQAEGAGEGAAAAGPWGVLARALEGAGDAAGALSAWQTARVRDPALREPRVNEVRILESLGRADEAFDALVSHANHPLAAGDEAGGLLVRAARTALSRGEKERACELAERAKRFGPLDAELDALVRAAVEERARKEREAKKEEAPKLAVPWITPIAKIRTDPPPALPPNSLSAADLARAAEVEADAEADDRKTEPPPPPAPRAAPPPKSDPGEMFAGARVGDDDGIDQAARPTEAPPAPVLAPAPASVPPPPPSRPTTPEGDAPPTVVVAESLAQRGPAPTAASTLAGEGAPPNGASLDDDGIATTPPEAPDDGFVLPEVPPAPRMPVIAIATTGEMEPDARDAPRADVAPSAVDPPTIDPPKGDSVETKQAAPPAPATDSPPAAAPVDPTPREEPRAPDPAEPAVAAPPAAPALEPSKPKTSAPPAGPASIPRPRPMVAAPETPFVAPAVPPVVAPPALAAPVAAPPVAAPPVVAPPVVAPPVNAPPAVARPTTAPAVAPVAPLASPPIVTPPTTPALAAAAPVVEAKPAAPPVAPPIAGPKEPPRPSPFAALARSTMVDGTRELPKLMRAPMPDALANAEPSPSSEPSVLLQMDDLVEAAPKPAPAAPPRPRTPSAPPPVPRPSKPPVVTAPPRPAPAPPAVPAPTPAATLESARPTLVGVGDEPPPPSFPALPKLPPVIAGPVAAPPERPAPAPETELPSIVIDPDFLEEGQAQQAALDASLASAPPAAPAAPALPFNPGGSMLTAMPQPPPGAAAPSPAPRSGSGAFAVPNTERPAWMTPVAMPPSPFAKLSGAFAAPRGPASPSPAPQAPAGARYQRIMAAQYLEALERRGRG